MPFILFFLGIFLCIVLLKLFLYTSAIFATLADFLIIGGIIVYQLHQHVLPQFVSSNAIFFWDFLIFIVVVIFYKIFLGIIGGTLPLIAKIVHYIMTWIGTFFVYIFISIIIFQGLPPLLDHIIANEIANLIIVSILAFILFTVRIRHFVFKEKEKPVSIAT